MFVCFSPQGTFKVLIRGLPGVSDVGKLATVRHPSLRQWCLGGFPVKTEEPTLESSQKRGIDGGGSCPYVVILEGTHICSQLHLNEKRAYTSASLREKSLSPHHWTEPFTVGTLPLCSLPLSTAFNRSLSSFSSQTGS